jgi:hypothetical protein
MKMRFCPNTPTTYEKDLKSMELKYRNNLHLGESDAVQSQLGKLG